MATGPSKARVSSTDSGAWFVYPSLEHSSAHLKLFPGRQRHAVCGQPRECGSRPRFTIEHQGIRHTHCHSSLINDLTIHTLCLYAYRKYERTYTREHVCPMVTRPLITIDHNRLSVLPVRSAPATASVLSSTGASWCSRRSYTRGSRYRLRFPR